MTCSRVKGSVTRGLRDFCGSPRDSLVGRTSSREKHFDKIFKIFVLSVLAIGPGDFLATWLSHENHVSWLNVFSFPSNICDYSLSFLSEPLSKSQCSHTNSHILHILYPPSPIFKQRYGFCFLFNMCYISCYIPLGLCVFVVYLIVEYGYLISDGFGVYCWCLCSDFLCSACILS